MDPSQFLDDVRDVLTHLYDRPYLQNHRLADLLVAHQIGELGGHALQRLLIDAIEALKPSRDVPYDSLAWRKYRYLYLRYVQGLPVPEIAGDLGISLRQSRRYSHESLAAVTRILQDRYEDARRQDAPVSADTSVVEREMARLEAETEATTAALGEVLEGVVATVRPLADRRGVGLKVEIPPDAPTVAVGRTILRQVLVSVLSLNLELGPLAVEMSFERATAESDVEIQIRALPRIPVATALTRLRGDERWPIAQRLLEAHGGTILAKLTDDQELVIGLRIAPIREWSVLVVDDNPDAIELYRRYLGDQPFRVIAELDGAGALARAETDRPAVILLDVMMPARDGWETLQTLKGRPETREIPVIVCSVLKERELALALGAADALVKPVQRADLLRVLEWQCRAGQAARRG